MKCKKFQLIAESTNVKLTKDVNKFIKEGWELYGTPFIRDGLFFQALILPLDNTKEDEKE